MRPKIGLTSASIDQGGLPFNLKCGVNRTYVDWIVKSGGLPLVLPITVPDDEVAGEMLDSCDALLLSGGRKLSPLYYGHEPQPHFGEMDPPRDAFELPLARLALARGLPILGICRGIQMLNVAAGGTLRQVLPQDPTVTVQHRMAVAGGPAPHHTVQIEPGSRLHQLVGQSRLAVNSYHDQAVGDVGAGLRPVAHAMDGVIEAIEASDGRPLLAVQWHPEALPGEPAATQAIFGWLMEAAREAAAGQ